MWLADTSIKKPVFATMVILGLVLLGVVSYPRIGVDLFPKVDFPIVNISTRLKGANAEIMDIDVTDKVEATINTINGVKTITSSSTEGRSQVVVEFVLERNIDLAVQDVREKISAIRGSLPRDIEEPVIEKVDPDANPILWLALSGDKTIRELSTYADEVLREQLQKINGVGAVRMAGLQLREVIIWLDSDKLSAYGITAHDILNKLQRENIELPGGRIEGKTTEYSIKIKGEFANVPDFNDLVVGYQSGAAVRLRDIGRVEDGMQEKRSITRFNRVPAVGFGIQKQSGTNTVEVVERIKKELLNIEKSLPPGMNIGISFDQSTFIKRSISEVQHHLIYGGFFATIAVLFFLRSIRITLFSALAIPTSIIATFAIMNVFGFTFNNMTMLALSLSVGILIDDAIIVIENIHRHIERGLTPKEAASFATSEIGLAVSATTLAIIVIFLPVAFMKGIIGRFFFQFAMTVVFAVAVSLFVSFTLIPMLASRFLKSKEGTAHHPGRLSSSLESGYLRVEEWYKKLLGIALNHRAIVVVSAAIIFIVSMYLVKFIGKEFLPSEDQSRFIVRLEAPKVYSIDETENLFKGAEEFVLSVPEVKTVFYGQGTFGETNKGSMFVGLKPKAERTRSQQEIMVEVRNRLRRTPGLKGFAEDVSLVGGGQRMVPIQYTIKGRDLTGLQEYSKSIVAEFSKLPGIVDVDSSLETGKPELRVHIDRDKAADLGVDIASVAETINLLVSGEVETTKYRDEARGRRYNVKMKLNPDDRDNPDDIKRLYTRSKYGQLVELSNIVTIQPAGGPGIINRVDRQRAITLFANLEGKTLGEAMTELNAISAKIIPSDYSTGYKGMAEMMGESFGYLMFALVLGVILAYMVLASQYESFIHPITVLLSMPFSFIGAFLAILITGKTLNIFTFIGLILLMGLVKKNAILLVDYTNTLRARGMERKEAILTAGPVRLRPILMTTFAMVLGMMPIAIGIGEGAETRSPMAIATIGGLITSLFLTLVVVPVVYDLFDEMQTRIFKKRAVS